MSEHGSRWIGTGGENHETSNYLGKWAYRESPQLQSEDAAFTDTLTTLELVTHKWDIEHQLGEWSPDDIEEQVGDYNATFKRMNQELQAIGAHVEDRHEVSLPELLDMSHRKLLAMEETGQARKDNADYVSALSVHKLLERALKR